MAKNTSNIILTIGYESCHIDDYKRYAKRNFQEAKKLYDPFANIIEGPIFSSKGEFWDLEGEYPKNSKSFIEKYFKKKKLDPIEGIWETKVEALGFKMHCKFGIVKEGSAYGYYMIRTFGYVNFAFYSVKNLLKSFFKNTSKRNMSLYSGMKWGVINKITNSQKYSFKSKFICPLHTKEADETQFPILSIAEDYLYFISDRELGSVHYDKVKDYMFLKEKITYKRYWPPVKLKKQKIISKEANKNKIETGKQPEAINNDIPINKEEKNIEGRVPKVGTGFFINKNGHIVTNHHVIAGYKEVNISYNDDVFIGKVIAIDEKLDLALIKTNINNTSFLKFSKSAPKRAQEILVAGYPFGKSISDDIKISAGIINSLKGMNNDTSMLQIDAAINIGNSGGPIIDKLSGNLVGVATGTLNKDFTKLAFGSYSENMNYGIKASQVKDFIEANGIKVLFNNKVFQIEELEKATIFISTN